MDDDRHLDGNVLAGALNEVFGREMTDQHGCCGQCGAVNALGSVHVYIDAPGTVLRCPGCGSVLMVMVERPDGIRVVFEAIRWIDSRSDLR